MCDLKQNSPKLFYLFNLEFVWTQKTNALPQKVRQLNNFTYVIIDDDYDNGLKTKQIADGFQNLTFLASVTNYDDAVDAVLEFQPDFIFLEVDPSDTTSNLSLHIINELHRYLSVVPKVFVTTKNDTLSLNAFKFGVFDYLLFPIETKELRKSLLRLDKELVRIPSQKTVLPIENTATISTSPTLVSIDVTTTTEAEVFEEQNITNAVNEDDFIENDNDVEEVLLESEKNVSSEDISVVSDEELIEVQDNPEVKFIQNNGNQVKPLIICVKSYGDYRYIEAKDICFLQADNNSTDIHLNTGEMITAFKTLKHFEGVLKHPFMRIHNSHIVNIDYISRIHTGNAVCHIKNTTIKLPFSKSYKENIDAIILKIASGNYLEI